MWASYVLILKIYTEIALRQVFSDAAIELGDELVKRKIDLVYGGGSVGLMGLISQKVHEGGCHVLGVIPKALMPLEISGQTVGEVRTVVDMHERKAAMAKESDAFIALPGGYGTMEELLEMITWSQLGIHKKPFVGLMRSQIENNVWKESWFKLDNNTFLPTNRLRLMKAGIRSSSEIILNSRMHSEFWWQCIRIIHAVSELSLVYGHSSHYSGVIYGCYHSLKGKDTWKCKRMVSSFNTISSNE
ncbi:hypothetical protein OIU76_009016 [Salix suchowensis]|nr:hypothetical protein OIU76_009016 [Salix suchowensis]